MKKLFLLTALLLPVLASQATNTSRISLQQKQVLSKARPQGAIQPEKYCPKMWV